MSWDLELSRKEKGDVIDEITVLNVLRTLSDP